MTAIIFYTFIWICEKIRCVNSFVKTRNCFALPVSMHSFKSIICIFSFTRVVLHLFRQNRNRQEHMQPRFFFSFINDVFSELCNSVTCKEKHLVLSYYRSSAVITPFEPNKQNTWLIYCGPCGWGLCLVFTFTYKHMNASEQSLAALIKIPFKVQLRVFDKYIDKLINYINIMIYL